MKKLFNTSMAGIVIFNIALGMATFTGINHLLWIIISSLAFIHIIKITDINY